MTQLSITFNSSGFHFQQVERTDNLAIYQKSRLGGRWTGFEVIRIRQHGRREIMGSVIEPREAYPPSGKWGVDGWSCFELCRAQEILSKLVKRGNATIKKGIPAPVSTI